MFDWNDQEITDIVWGEPGKSDDHTVPYPDGSEGKAPVYGDKLKKACSLKASNIKTIDQKKPATKTDLSNIKLECSSKHDTSRATITTGDRVESSADTPLTNATTINQDSLGAETPINLTEVMEHECFRGADGERNQLADDSQNFHHRNEDLEQGDFIDYGWANIGSFDDLDKIFSNNDPIFGDTSLLNTHGLWSSCKEMRRSPDKSIPLSICSQNLSQSPSKRLEVKAEYRLDQEKSSTGDVDIVNDVTSNLPVYTDARDHRKDRSVVSLQQKGNRRKTISKGRPELEQDSEVAQFQELCKFSSPRTNKFGMPYATNQPCLDSELTQQRQLQGPEHLQHKHFAGPHVASSSYGDTGNQYSPVPVWSQFFSGQASPKHVLSSYKAAPGNSSDASLRMTPQEKIEKLRRRQQLRAMLAIQKQQLQFSYQIAKEGGSVEENLSRIPPSSPLEQGAAGNMTLYLLQDVISKLDLQIRLCIRDSLFRLAQSATQRQFGNNSCSTKDSSREVKKEEINTIYRPCNVETETNPIDRTVAHLLFHNPSDLAEIPIMVNCEKKALSISSRSSSETNTSPAPECHEEVDEMKSA